ncbi:MAG TPA: S41 family peptidase [Allosphingosinicella sp.]|jgi:hypothetical protein
MRTGILKSVAAAAALAAAAAGPAQPVRVAVPVPTAAARAPADAKAAVAEIRRVLAENYVLPEMRPKLDAALARGLAEGRYDVTEPGMLAERINTDLAAAGHDKHLNFHYAPEQSARIAGLKREPDDAPADAEQVRRAERGNHGIAELKLLPGNIRYMDLEGFVWAGPKSAEAYDNAMRFLRGGDALIIDLRHNGGGSPEAVQYLVSHFLAPNTPLVTFHMGATKVDHLSTLAQLPAGRMVGKPLYVLTSGRTASAAEEFTGHVAGYRLGELIGETTAGAGFRNDFFAIPGGFLLSVSVGRAVLASTGKDWEGVGIAPTSAVPVDSALDVAQLHALRRLAAAAPAGDKAQLEARAALLGAKLEPVTLALPLQAYAGNFGERAVAVENGRLTYQRAGGPKLAMIAIGPNLFTFEDDPMARVEYRVSGATASGFDLVRADGSRVPAERTP